MPKKKLLGLPIEEIRRRSLEYAKGNAPEKSDDWKPRRAHELRDTATRAERYIAPPLRKLGFVHSELLFGYFADFYHRKAKLVVEIDGGYHETRRDKDAARDAHLAKRGIMTIRLTNEQATHYTTGNLEKIRLAVADRLK